MGLLANNFRDSFAVGRLFGATISNGSNPSAVFSSSHRVGSFRNIFAGEGDIDPLSSIPAGARHPVAWQMPQKAGGLASHNNTSVTLSPTASGALGLPGSGSSTLTFTADGTGGLIVSGSGSATISFSPTATILSIAAASGSTTVTFTPTASIGALAGLVGTATVTLTPAAISYAIGYLSGTSTNETEFSADALAQAVWEVAASDFNTAGTMGEKLNDAGSAGNPWASLLASNNSAGSFGEFVQSLPSAADVSTQLMDSTDLETGITVKEALRIVLAALSGKISGAGTNTITIRDVNDTTDRIVATVDGDGNRTAVSVDGS